MKKYNAVLSLFLVIILIAACSKLVPPPVDTATASAPVPTPVAPASAQAITDTPTAAPAAPEKTKAPEPDPRIKAVPVYSYDLTDKSLIYYSSGTGGPKWLYDDSIDYEDCFTKSPDNEFIVLPSITSDPGEPFLYVWGLKIAGLDDRINSFLKESRNALIYDSDFWGTDGKCLGVNIRENAYIWGNLASIELNSYNNDDRLRKKGKTISAVFDLKTGKRLTLSDLFYDSVNYIDIINSKIVSDLNVTFEGDPLSELMQKRSFPGIPMNYPYFYVNYGYLYMDFPHGNPFFSYKESLDIRLDKDISPYGKESESRFETHYRLKKLNDSLSILEPQFLSSKSPDIALKVNSQIEKWINGIFSDEILLIKVLKFSKVYYDNKLMIEPTIGKWGKLISISYNYDQYYYEMPSINDMLISTMTFDTESGEAVNLREKIPEDLDWIKARYYLQITPEDKNDDYSNIEDPYVFKVGSTIDSAWIRNNYYLCIQLTEPDGRVVIAQFELKDLKEPN